MRRRLVFLTLLLAYGCLFWQQERISQSAASQLPFPMPAVVEKAFLGYLRHLGGELHFIQSAVYVGGFATKEKHVFSPDRVAAHLESAAELNPTFVDTYFYCQSIVATEGDEHTRRANSILKKGITALPNNWMLPFFMGFNHFHYLNDPGEAADLMLTASKAPGAPPWLGHLASVLAAKGGDIRTGLIWLSAMHDSEKDENVRRSYEDDIADFKMALRVQKAVSAFGTKYGRVPFNLDELVPEFLIGLPEFKGNFILSWEPPVLRMVRPHVK